MSKPEYCQAIDEDTPCSCGATKLGYDAVGGICQAHKPYPEPRPLVEIVLTRREL